MSVKLVALGVSALAVAALSMGSFFTVDQGERGVVIRSGKVVAVHDAGLYYKLPFIDSVKTIDVRSKARQYESVSVISSDQQMANLVLSFNYSIPADKAEQVYVEYGNEENLLSRLVERQLMAQVRNVFGSYNAQRSVTERSKLSGEIQMAVQKAVGGPVNIESVQIENVAFSRAYNEKIEERMSAEIAVQKVAQDALREEKTALITVTKAQAEADSLRAKAAASAEAVKLAGEAEAAAIKAKGDALRENPGLVALTAAEKWDGKLPATMVPGSTVPFVNVK
ncbi:SPFH-domain membrane protein [Rhizobium phage Pasto]|uniref:SPFH-domain membrane protein n=1 Tax=Rhizobium phage Pasto TaxID=2767575 RepID=A0A7S6R6W5_9CAUD|nr:SPFH-domain membrane protein [Rhizobium phage Pasto]